MSLSAAEIARVLEEIAPACTGARIDRIREHAGQDLLLELYQGGRRRVLLLSTHRQGCRLHFTSRPKGTGAQAGAFARLLRARLQPGRIAQITQLPGDRVVEILCQGAGDGGAPHRLVAELLGPRADIHLYEGGGGRHLGSLRGRKPAFEAGGAGPPAPKGDVRAAREFADTPGGGSYAERVAAHYRSVLAACEAERRRGEIGRALRRESKRLDRLEKNLAADAERAAEGASLREKGELLKAYAGRVPAGSKQCELPAFADPARRVLIALHSGRSAAANADGYFARARKAERTAGQVATRRARLAARREALEGLRERLEEARAEVPALEHLAADMGLCLPPGSDAKHPDGRSPGGGPGRRALARLGIKPRCFVSAAGQAIFVGRSERENDLLTTRFARPQDYFFHVSGASGAHVIACLEKGQELAEATRREAARLALYYSALGKSARGEVSYAERRYVRKRRGDPPGAVHITACRKTLWVELEEGSGPAPPVEGG